MQRRFGLAVCLLTFTPSFAEEMTQHLQRQTKNELRTAMADEAFTVLEYTAFAEHARKEGKIALADIFDQKVKDEKQHFDDFARLYGLADWHNIAKAIVDGMF